MKHYKLRNKVIFFPSPYSSDYLVWIFLYLDEFSSSLITFPISSLGNGHGCLCQIHRSTKKQNVFPPRVQFYHLLYVDANSSNRYVDSISASNPGPQKFLEHAVLLLSIETSQLPCLWNYLSFIRLLYLLLMKM